MAFIKTGRICFFGTYERDYLRNRTLIEGLRRSGWKIYECHIPLWEKERNKTGKYLGPVSLIVRIFELKLAYLRLVLKYIFMTGKYDVMIVGYIGHLDMPLAWLLTRLPRRPLVFSPLISLYDTLVHDRGVFSDRTLMSWFLGWLDRWACARADSVLMDTNAHIDYFIDTFNLPHRRFTRVFVGAEKMKVMEVSDFQNTMESRAFHVVSIGKFTPLHGLEVMLGAAQILKGEPEIVFNFIGSGQLIDKIQETAQEMALENVRFPGWIPYEFIPNYLDRADVCLGIFGTTGKAARVIPGKVYEALAMGKAVITGDSPAIRELLVDGESAILCPRGNPESLASEIHRLYKNRDILIKISEGGRVVFGEQASVGRIGQSASVALDKLLTSPD